MVSTEAFFCLNRDDVKTMLMNTVDTLDDVTLKYAVHTLMCTYRPSMLEPMKENLTDAQELMATPDNIEWMMSKYNISREEAWSMIDDYNAKYGIHSDDYEESEAQEILASAVKNAIKRQEGSNESVKVYVPPPRVRDAEEFWPYMRCKNVVKAIHCYTYSNEQVPRSHYALLEYIAKYKGISVEALKKTHPADLFESNPYIMSLFAE
jgi:hypothetical protein